MKIIKRQMQSMILKIEIFLLRKKIEKHLQLISLTIKNNFGS